LSNRSVPAARRWSRHRGADQFLPQFDARRDPPGVSGDGRAGQTDPGLGGRDRGPNHRGARRTRCRTAPQGKLPGTAASPLPLAAYAGTYTNRPFGDLTAREEGGSLALEVGHNRSATRNRARIATAPALARCEQRPTLTTAQMSTVEQGWPSDPRPSSLPRRGAGCSDHGVARSNSCVPELPGGISVVRALVRARDSAVCVGSLVRPSRSA
jgi:hypothetical protein